VCVPAAMVKLATMRVRACMHYAGGVMYHAPVSNWQ
jgi:hypothetical protein